jgi:hypothetical protein
LIDLYVIAIVRDDPQMSLLSVWKKKATELKVFLSPPTKTALSHLAQQVFLLLSGLPSAADEEIFSAR